MKKLIVASILLSSLAHGQIIPVDSSVKLVQDELFPYQWGLMNQGQTLIREKDDIHNLPLIGIPGKDIGWKNLNGKVTKNRPIVAVLDSGVDLNHPELQGNLWKNEEECGKDPSIDNDGNRLPGDCHGWNFTEDLASAAAKDVTDIDGHGTHIAGIIAAANNGIGMVGVVPNALIMPIKVMKDPNSSSQVLNSVAFARGIQYAVDNGADVINMSLGWPRSLETKELRDAVSYALSQGVVIVAAAGNNNSSEPLFPCAYDGVICVAASTVTGKFASFSNYGGHVDAIAPGESILGLNPILFEPDFFAVPGYELRSGTSQATPFVAGLVAALKARGTVTIDDVFAKLYQAQDNADKNKYILGGEATWNAIEAEISGPVVRPTFKKVRQILFRGDSKSTRLVIPVRNFGLSSGEVTVRAESLSSAIAIEDSSKDVSDLDKGEFVDIPFEVTLKNENAESSIAIKVTIESNGETRSYVNEIPVVRDIRTEARFARKNFKFTDKPIPLGFVRNGELQTYLSTIESVIPGKHEFFLKRTIQEGNTKKLEVTIFSRKGNEYIQAPNLIFVDNALSLVNLIRVDLNRDGKEDYILQTLAGNDDKRYFVFSFYDENMKPLWKEFQDVKLTLDLYLESMNDISFVKLDHPTLGKMMVPAFYTLGQLPKADQPITSWDRFDTNRKKRLYYLEPGEKELKVRALTTNVWEEAIKKDLKSKWYETVEVEQLLPVSVADAKNGMVRALVSVGQGTKRQLFIHSFDAKNTTRGSKLPQLVLQSDSVDPLLSLSDEGLKNDGELYFNIYDRTRAKLVTTRGESQVGEFIFRHETESDLIAGHIASFEKGSNRFTVFQTREELISISSGGTQKRSSRPKLRYSFLTQKLLSEMYFPVSYKRDGQSSPALYVDATAVTGNRIYLFEEQQGELVSSVKNSIVVPSGCKSMNPAFSPEAGTHEFIFICIEENNFVIRTYGMN